MAILTDENRRDIEQYFIDSGLVTQEKLDELKVDATDHEQPLITYMISEGVIDDEQLTQAISHVTHVPYANLSHAAIPSEVLALLPMEVAQRFMAVPLGETTEGGAKRLAVAMLDANNVQAIDFLSNEINRPLKVYLASESGINNILSQYHLDVDDQ